MLGLCLEEYAAYSTATLCNRTLSPYLILSSSVILLQIFIPINSTGSVFEWGIYPLRSQYFPVSIPQGPVTFICGLEGSVVTP